MKRIDERNFLVEGDLYTDMPFNPALLSSPGVIIHARGDVIFQSDKPNKMKSKDSYMNYIEFSKTYGPILDIRAFSKI